MSAKLDEGIYPSTGTTPPHYIPRDGFSATVRPGQTYFLVKIHAAQAAFTGPIWERVKRLIVTSQVSLGDEPVYAIQRSREVHKNRAEQLGLCPNLINLVPATKDRVSITLEFILDKENQLAALAGLINDDAFLSAISLAPGAAMVAQTISKLAQKILQTFLRGEEREPILQFSGDFNVSAGELRDGYYVILGTRDERNPLPRPLPALRVQHGELLANGKPVTQWSYIVLDVRCVSARTRDLNEGALWEKKLREAEAIAQCINSNWQATQTAREEAWKKCQELLKEAQVLLGADPNYLYREAQDIIKAAYKYCSEQIFTQEAARARGVYRNLLMELPALRADLAFFGIPPDEDIQASVERYTEQVFETRRLIRQEGIR